MATDVDVLEAGHGSGGIRLGPMTRSASFCKAMNFRKGDSCFSLGMEYTGGVREGAFSMSSARHEERKVSAT